MTKEQLDQTAAELGVEFTYDPTRPGEITIEGKRAAVAEAHARVANCRAEVAALLRKEMGLVDPDDEIVRLTVPARSVPALAVQSANYRSVWLPQKPKYYWPTEEELTAMEASPEIEAGDELLPDFAHSVSVRKRSGLLIAIDRKGRRCDVPQYSPHRVEVAK